VAVNHGPAFLGGVSGLTVLLLVILLAPLRASAHTLTDEELKGVGFTQHPGSKVPTDATFLDESGRSVRIGDYFKDRPVILTLNYLRCPNLCPIILSSLAADLNGLPFALGDQYTVLTVGIDPRDTPAQAVDTRAKALQMYERSGGEAGWHMLTGMQDQVDLLASTVGFQYQYDADQDE
jgi:protein SCO1